MMRYVYANRDIHIQTNLKRQELTSTYDDGGWWITNNLTCVQCKRLLLWYVICTSCNPMETVYAIYNDDENKTNSIILYIHNILNDVLPISLYYCC